MKSFFRHIFPLEKGLLPYAYLANISIPLYFMLQEPAEKLYPGLVLLGTLLFIYRRVYWKPQQAQILIPIEIAITLFLSFAYDPMYLYIVFIFIHQIVYLQMPFIYFLSGLFAVSSLLLIIIPGTYARLDLIISLLPPIFGGSILPFIMKVSIRYKEVSLELAVAAEQLEKKNKELLLMEESKKRMLVDISHDLKTPITTIQGYSKVLYEGMVQDKEQEKKYLKYIYDKSIRVSTLIDELFMFSKLENPEFPIHKEEADICEFIREIIVENYNRFEEKNISLSVDIPEVKIPFLFDKKLLYRVITNLIENAIKYNPLDTNVLIIVRKRSERLHIEIADNGVKITDEMAQHLFEPFVRGDKNRADDGGTGLGLSISKKIVELHHGIIKLDTSPPAWEKKFVIMLPIDRGGIA